MELHLIWAQSLDGVIGRNNTLPWHLPEDLRRFKAVTLGHPVIMGRKTFESLPGGALPGRLNLVLSGSRRDLSTRGATWAKNLDDARRLAAETGATRAYVIGGAQVYREALAYADVIERTLVDVEVSDGDAFAPVIPSYFELEEASGWKTSGKGLRFQFERWRKHLAC